MLVKYDEQRVYVVVKIMFGLSDSNSFLQQWLGRTTIILGLLMIEEVVSAILAEIIVYYPEKSRNIAAIVKGTFLFRFYSS